LSYGLRIEESGLLLRGYQALRSKGRIVWTGPVGAPIEDAVCDTIIMHPDDAARLRQRLSEENGK
jgi:hypothetical protein